MNLIVHIKKKLKNFNLAVDFETDGTPMGILGASGCGKSMTLKCIAGIMTPDEGYIELNGRVLYDSNRKINMKPQQRNVGYLFQNFALFPNMTVWDNITIGIKGPKKDKSSQVQRMVDYLQLNGLEKRYPTQLSGGQQQRVALARILAYQPDVLLLDEPFSALDAYLKEELQIGLSNILKEYHGESLLVTHSRDEAYKLCQRLAVFHNGQVLEIGETKEVFAQPKKVQVARLTGCKNISRARKISENQVEALDWGLTFTVNTQVTDNLAFIGIRAHDFIPCNNSDRLNTFECKVHAITEEPFEWNVLVDTGNIQTKVNSEKSLYRHDKIVDITSKDQSCIWWKVGKSQVTNDFIRSIPRYLSVDTEKILFLEE